MLRKSISLVLVTLWLLMLAGCDRKEDWTHDDLIGKYDTFDESDRGRPYYRVEKASDGYLLYERTGQPKKVVPVERAELESILKKKLPERLVALGDDKFILFKVSGPTNHSEYFTCWRAQGSDFPMLKE